MEVSGLNAESEQYKMTSAIKMDMENGGKRW